MSGIPAMFLDRDGVIIENAHYLARLEDIRLIHGSAAAIRRLNEFGMPVIVVSNQSGVARGYFAESFVQRTQEFLNELLAREGARVDAWYFCPHHPDFGANCDCRKPKPGMLRTAALDWNLDLSRSWLVGDNITDIEAGAAAGCRNILVRTGHGASMTLPADSSRIRLEAVVETLADAVDYFARTRTARLAA